MTAAAIVFVLVFAGVVFAGLSKEICDGDQDESRSEIQCRGARRAA